ncbi:MAG: hypothetical protein HY036_09395 [Nitrospirae bacterium]|nr:hypothetical protein [Nitrospirota bacterium]MBI3352778.1 hypothetical protein [Nitrospirota bacterium]
MKTHTKSCAFAPLLNSNVMPTKMSSLWNVLGPATGVFFGAFLGALFSYWFAIHQQAQETEARREALLKLLQSEVSQIGGTLEPYNVAKSFYRDPIRLNAPTRLLDGQTLEYRKDAWLIELLLNLNVAISRHNDFVQMTNQAQATATIPVPDNTHAQWYRDLQQRLTAVVAVRDEILKKLKRNP